MHILKLILIALMMYTTCFANAGTLKIHGNLKHIANNTLNTPLNLAQIEQPKHLYGIGMPAGLGRELLIFKGVTYTSQFRDFQYEVTKDDKVDIAFLVYNEVEDWQEIAIPNDVVNFEQLQGFVQQSFIDNGIDTVKGSMFQIHVQVHSLSWFVVGGMGDLRPTPLKSFLHQKLHGGLNTRKIMGLGAFTLAHQGRATSGKNLMHIHFKTVDEQTSFVGHLNNKISLKPGGRLLIPKK